MSIDYVLTAVTTDAKYVHFVSNFVLNWNFFYPDVKVIILVVGDGDIPNVKGGIAEFVPFAKVDGVSDAFVSQCARLYYPSLITSANAVLISDIDIYPLDNRFFTRVIQAFEKDAFIIFRDVLNKNEEIPICYNAALPNVWADIFDIHNISDVIDRLKNDFSRQQYTGKRRERGWSTDQKIIFKAIARYQINGGKVIRLNDEATGYRRLDRASLPSLTNVFENSLIVQSYCDYHALEYLQDPTCSVNDFICKAARDPKTIRDHSGEFIELWNKCIKAGAYVKISTRILDLAYRVGGFLLPRNRRTLISEKLLSFYNKLKF